MFDSLSQNFKYGLYFVISYHWLPLATIDLVGDNTEFDFKFKKIENHNCYNYNQYEPACGILSLLDILQIKGETFKVSLALSSGGSKISQTGDGTQANGGAQLITWPKPT